MSWTPWTKICSQIAAGGGGATWSSLAGKPATFPPDAHSHNYQPVGSYMVAADLTWAALNGKPSTFAPSTHTHPISDVVNLQAALDGKQASGSYALASHNHAGVYQPAGSYAASVHTHVITDVTGLQAALDAKQVAGSYALTSHNHDAAYAAIGHNHSGVYQPVGNYLTILGYSTGSGGAITQATSKATTVVLNKLCGNITLNAAALAAGAIVTFVFTNSTVAAEDQIIATHHSGGTFGSYLINARATGAGAASVAVRNTSAASLSEAIVIKFTVLKGAAS